MIIIDTAKAISAQTEFGLNGLLVQIAADETSGNDEFTLNSAVVEYGATTTYINGCG